MDAGGITNNRIDSTLGELVDFTNPSNSLTINAGNGADTINIEGVSPTFDASLTVNGNDANDIVNFQINATTIGSGDLTVTSETLFVSANISTTGSINTTTAKSTEISNSAILTTVNGDITIIAGTASVPGDDFIGVLVNSGMVHTTGNGNISITGTGAFNSNNSRYGIQMLNGAVVQTAGTGSISMTGTGGAGGSSNQGVRIQDVNTEVTAVEGDIDILRLLHPEHSVFQ